ncbi:futalosine hydrolase [Deinobacterium chartae]|uniref:Futalosine hydrolase n=1 Tax=Deinobacterium chartae TaxID=521158 RepID=A0A841I3C0_9DEIO|nr:futalosine hydrolase [Deinobacterium chartae]MBB6099793.1 futalosine hydrolase [Deinobacterium chartae]
MKLALICATDLEAHRFGGLGLEVKVSGVGAVNAALATAELIREARPELVINVGIGGAYPGSGLQTGAAALSSEFVYAGLGARDGAQFLDLETLGFPVLPGWYNRLPAWERAAALAARLGLPCGPFLTLETVTGSLEAARELEARYPGALIEGMEGAGVAHAALRAGVPALELRGVSNPVGPRDRTSWRIGPALEAARAALEGLLLALR